MNLLSPFTLQPLTLNGFDLADPAKRPVPYVDPDKLSDKKGITQARKDVVQITAQILVGLSVAYGGYLAWQRLEVSREDQINDRYTRAIDQLGSEKLEIRLGGIYALVYIAQINDAE